MSDLCVTHGVRKSVTVMRVWLLLSPLSVWRYYAARMISLPFALSGQYPPCGRVPEASESSYKITSSLAWNWLQWTLSVPASSPPLVSPLLLQTATHSNMCLWNMSGSRASWFSRISSFDFSWAQSESTHAGFIVLLGPSMTCILLVYFLPKLGGIAHGVHSWIMQRTEVCFDLFYRLFSFY